MHVILIKNEEYIIEEFFMIKIYRCKLRYQFENIMYLNSLALLTLLKVWWDVIICAVFIVSGGRGCYVVSPLHK